MCLSDEIIDTAFPFWIAYSFLVLAKWFLFYLQSSLKSVYQSCKLFYFVEGSNTPQASIATGLNLNLLTRSGYLALHLFSALAAA